jgi:hypothetical protein
MEAWKLTKIVFLFLEPYEAIYSVCGPKTGFVNAAAEGRTPEDNHEYVWL